MKLLDVIGYLIAWGIKFLSFVIASICIVIIMILLIGYRALKKENEKNYALQERYDQEREKCMVKLIVVGSDKIKIIRVLKEYTVWDFFTALEKIELPLPITIATDMPLSLAQELKTELAKLDTVIEIINLI